MASFSSLSSACRWRRSSLFFLSLSTSLTTLLRRLLAALLAPAPPPPPTPTPPAGPMFWFWFWIADSIRPAAAPFIERPELRIILQKKKKKTCLCY